MSLIELLGRSNLMLIKKNTWIIFLFVLAVLSACSSDNKEFDTFLNEVEQDISGEDADPDKYINEYIKQIESRNPEKALEILNEKEILKNEELVKKYKEMDFDNEDLTELQIDKELEILFDVHKKTIEVVEESAEIMQEVNEEYDQVELDEEQLETEVEMDASEMNEETDALIMAFIEIVADTNGEGF